MTQKIAFFDAKPYDIESFNNVNANFGFDITFFEARLNSRTASLSGSFDGVCAFVNDTIDSSVIDKLFQHKVQIIGLRCAGYNNIDFTAAYEKIHVVRVPAYSPYAVAEHAIALIMALNRKIYKAYPRTRDGNFSINGLMGFDMYGKTAAVIGTGKIGRCLIAILKGFGISVLAYDPYPDEEYAREQGFRYTTLKEIYQLSDIISLHCPLTPESEYMINAESIQQMKPGVMIINTGRGKLINTHDLIDALKSGNIGSAGLDVYEEENEYFFEDRSLEMITDDMLARLLVFPNVVLTSHQGFFTREALHNIALTTLNNFKEFFEGGYLKNEICYKCQGVCVKNENKRCFVL
ncbi:MAG: 2-hydroxyacid dehydrogenase [Kiritimatiellia bacterium]